MVQVHGLDVLSVYDSATGDVVQLNALGDDTEFVVRGLLDGEGVKSPEGTPYYGGDLSRVAVTFLDTGAGEYEILREWQRQGRMLRMAGAGPAGALLWHEDTLIQVVPEAVKGASGGARGYRLTAERRGHGSHRIWLDENLLAGPVGPISRGTYTPPGWALNSAVIAYYYDTEGVVSVTDTGAAGATLRTAEPLVYPVAGVVLTGSVGQTGAVSGQDLQVNALAFNGALIGVADDGLTSAIMPERVAAAMVTPPGTWSVAFSPFATAGGFAGGVQLYRPALRLGASTAPGALAV